MKDDLLLELVTEIREIKEEMKRQSEIMSSFSNSIIDELKEIINELSSLSRL